MADASSTHGTAGSGGFFPMTRWSMVVAARDSPSIERSEALGELCRQYWRPVYLYVRRRGHSAEETEDLTQDFFFRLVKGDLLKSVEGPEKGRLRSFLCVVLKRFLVDDYHRKMAQKRGGGRQIIDIDGPSMEGQIIEGKAEDPVQAFDRQWAIDLLEDALRRLKDDYARAGKENLFVAFQPTINPQSERVSPADLAGELGMTEGAVKVAVHRFRQRYRVCLMEALNDTLADGEDPEEELRYLLSLFGRS